MGRGRPRSGQGWGSMGQSPSLEPDPHLPTLLAFGELSLPIKGGKLLLVLLLTLVTAFMFEPSSASAAPPSQPQWAIVVHGGAGVIERRDLSPAQDAAYRAALGRVAEAGAAGLKR